MWKLVKFDKNDSTKELLQAWKGLKSQDSPLYLAFDSDQLPGPFCDSDDDSEIIAFLFAKRSVAELNGAFRKEEV